MMNGKTNRIWGLIAGAMTIALVVGAVPYFAWAVDVVSEPISNPLWPNKFAMFLDGVGFGLLYLVLGLWWITLPLAAVFVIVWCKALQKNQENRCEPAHSGYRR